MKKTDNRSSDEDVHEGHHSEESKDEPSPLGQEAPEIIDDASIIGSKRLHRSIAGTAITSFIGGLSVCFGAVSMAWASASIGGSLQSASVAHLVGSLFFPVGFIILLIGKSELFTENFFLPVTAVLERRGSLSELSSLWSVSLTFNLLGSLVFAALISRGAVLNDAPAAQLIELAEHKVDYSLSTSFVKALFAGWLMTMLTWLLVAAEGFGSKLVLIWIMGTLIVLGQFNHVVISAAEIFIGMMLGADVTLVEWLSRNFIPALVGNILGGVIFVTLLFYVQAQQGRKDAVE